MRRGEGRGKGKGEGRGERREVERGEETKGKDRERGEDREGELRREELKRGEERGERRKENITIRSELNYLSRLLMLFVPLSITRRTSPVLRPRCQRSDSLHTM